MYEPVLIYNIDGEHLGYSIKKEDSPIKLHTTNIWGPHETAKVEEQLAQLNDQAAVLAGWPDARDPAVLELLNDPLFEPIEMHEAEVIDEAASNIVYEKILRHDPETGLPVNPPEYINGDIDPAQSNIIYMTATVPVRPSDEAARIRKACETVARSVILGS